jgi:RNA polymerase sigma factor (sigma-70 family)
VPSCDGDGVDSLSQIIIRLRRLLRSRGRARDEIDDLIQDAFVRLQTYCRDREIVTPEAFLVRTALNLMIDARRKVDTSPRIQGGVESLVLVDPHPTPDEVLIGEERLKELNIGIEALSPRAREVFLLYRLEGYSYAQIAEQLGLSISTVEKHIAKASLSLFNWMAGERKKGR